MVTEVGVSEPCDWCGREGTVRQWDCWYGDRLACRNPALCDVCEMFWNLPGDVLDAMDEAGVDYERQLENFEAELERKWDEKVRAGTREPQHEGERSPMRYTEVRHTRPDQ